MVGVCAAVERDKPVARLKARGLASPDWKASWELVARHYAAGTRVAGIWLKRKKEDDREEVESIVELLINDTGLKVRLESLLTVLTSSFFRMCLVSVQCS